MVHLVTCLHEVFLHKSFYDLCLCKNGQLVLRVDFPLYTLNVATNERW